MTALAHTHFDLIAANDDADADIVPAHLMARRLEARLMLGAALLAATVLLAAMAHGVSVMSAIPDLATFAFRV